MLLATRLSQQLHVNFRNLSKIGPIVVHDLIAQNSSVRCPMFGKNKQTEWKRTGVLTNTQICLKSDLQQVYSSITRFLLFLATDAWDFANLGQVSRIHSRRKHPW
jgi:hypothetical protein